MRRLRRKLVRTSLLTSKGTVRFGRVVELVYTGDLKSPAERLEGSSPSPPTRLFVSYLGGHYESETAYEDTEDRT